MANLIVSRFRNLWTTKPTSNESLLDIISEIKSDKYKKIIEQINGDTKSPAKQQLPLFTPTGIFSHRSIKGLDAYNGVVCLDIDGIDNPTEVKEKCKSIPWVYAAFITPSYKGIKVIIQSNATKETYAEVEQKIANEFSSITGCIRDNHCKDIARIQYVSYDPDAYVNESAVKFKS